MLIKILEGTFGALENGVVVAKTSRSAPFEVDEKRGRQLVEAGYARKMRGDVQVSQELPVPDPNGEEREPGSGEAGSDPEDPGDVREELSGYSYNELRSMTRELGLKADGKKEELVDRIAAFRAGTLSGSEEPDGINGDSAGDLDAEGGVVTADGEGDPDAADEAFPVLQPEEPV